MTAEDAVGAAFEAALSSWAASAPTHPEAWLSTVATRKAIDEVRRTKKTLSLDLASVAQDAEWELQSEIPDERLRLFFLCAHPALDPSIQCPLMLQLVVGMTVAEIAEIYLEPEATLAQRLVRAKRKIRDAGIPARVPDPEELPEYADSVLSAIYGLYYREWVGDAEPDGALEMAMILASLMPGHAEALGLAALIALSDCRRSARYGSEGEYIPLEAQAPAQWNFAKFELGEAYARKASQLGAPGRFQIEAAIQSAHMHRRLSGRPSWATIVGLYNQLISFAPTMGFLVGRAAALANAEGPKAALAELDRLELDRSEAVRAFAPFFATRAHVLWELDRHAEAKEMAAIAIQLTRSDPERGFLRTRFGTPVP